MDLLSRVKSTIEKHRLILPGDKVLVGVSGGPDSVALLHLMIRLRDELQCSLYAGHLNHMFRGDEAGADARLVESLAGDWGVPCVTESFNVPEYLKEHGLSVQQGARDVRYRFFEGVAARLGADRVALGHHADDQAETVLLNLIRGTGITGLGGIPPVRGGLYIRPLLEIRRRQIERYCHDCGLPYRVDSSNTKAVYLRNRVRQELIPLLEEKYNPAMVGSLNRLSGIARDEDEYLEGIAGDALENMIKVRETGKIVISSEMLNKYPAAIKRRVVRMAYRELAGYGRAPTLGQVDRALELSASGGTHGGTVELPGGIALVKKSHLLEIIINRKDLRIPFYRRPLQVPGFTPVPEVNRGILAETLEASRAGDLRRYSFEEAVFDFERLQGTLWVRRRMDGDMFFPLGAGGKVKLKKFLIDQKAPREERDAIPIVTCGNDIIWVAGYRPGEPWKVTGETRVCLHMAITPL